MPWLDQCAIAAAGYYLTVPLSRKGSSRQSSPGGACAQTEMGPVIEHAPGALGNLLARPSERYVYWRDALMAERRAG